MALNLDGEMYGLNVRYLNSTLQSFKKLPQDILSAYKHIVYVLLYLSIAADCVTEWRNRKKYPTVVKLLFLHLLFVWGTTKGSVVVVFFNQLSIPTHVRLYPTFLDKSTDKYISNFMCSMYSRYTIATDSSLNIKKRIVWIVGGQIQFEPVGLGLDNLPE